MSDIELQELVINEAESDEVVERQTDLNPNQIIVTPTGASGIDYYGLPVGSIFSSAIPVVDARVHLLDGSLITQSGIYAEFATLIKTLVSSGQLISCTQAEFTADVANYGQCGKFVIDDANNAIRLPKITEFIASNNGGKEIGLAELDMFKSHMHNITSSPNQNYNGSTTYQGTSNWGGIQATGSASGNASFYASHTGGSETRPKNIRYPYYIVLASGYKQQSQLDVDNIMNDVNGLANQFEQKPWLLDLYPVGTIYLTLNDKGSPASIFGGTWEKLPSGYALWTSSSSAGNTIGAGLPNITGSFQFTDNDNGNDWYVRARYADGAFYTSGNGEHYMVNSNGNSKGTGPYAIGFQASRSSSIYGSSSTVQPPAYKVYAYKRIS